MTDREILLANPEGLRLSHVERLVLNLRLGVPPDSPDGTVYSRPECARIIKTTIGRVRSLEAKALKKLRAESS